MTAEDLQAITEKMLDEIREAGGDIDDVAYCPHRPDERCGCRKPEPGLITTLARKHRLDLRDGTVYLVGDTLQDIEAGRRAGLRGIFIGDKTTPSPEGSEVIVGSLAEAVEWMINRRGEEKMKPTLKEIAEAFRGRTVFITGADGFIGSHLTEKMVEFGADVRVFVRATSTNELVNINHLKDRIKIYRGNLIDKHSVNSAIKDLRHGNDPIIFHLGAQAHVGESWERPYDTIASNILGTLNLLQSVIDNDVKLFKFDTAGTSEEYGNIREEVRHHYDFHESGGLVLHERSPINPKSIYATSKLASDFLTMNYFDAYGLPGVTTRMFNNYGPRQNPRYVTGVIITQALMRDHISLGYTRAKRDFCYVEDGAVGHIHVALYGNPGEVYVYGHGKNIAILDWMHLILKVGHDLGYWEEKPLVIEEQRFRPGMSDVEELLVGYEKLHNLTGWEPTTSWEEGIAKTIRWYAENVDRWVGRVDW